MQPTKNTMTEQMEELRAAVRQFRREGRRLNATASQIAEARQILRPFLNGRRRKKTDSCADMKRILVFRETPKWPA